MKLIILLSIAFGFSELLLALIKHSKSGTVKYRNDKGSMIILWIVITLGFTVGFLLSGPVKQFYAGAGFGLVFFGLIIRWISILQLGKSFTVDVAITNVARLKTDGIYERVRHPGYSGLLSIVIGFSLIMSSIYSFLLLAVPVFLAITYRISVEEKVLLNEFGDSYVKYKTSTRKLIPGIY